VKFGIGILAMTTLLTGMCSKEREIQEKSYVDKAIYAVKVCPTFTRTCGVYEIEIELDAPSRGANFAYS
jgi:hypothetical protein